MLVQEVNPHDKQSTSEVTGHPIETREEWREEFPYPWDEDEVVTRRHTLRFLLGGAGALFLAKGLLPIAMYAPIFPAR
jgi:hypothetical protein